VSINHQKGLLVAAILFLCWLLTLVGCLHWPLASVPVPCLALAIAVRTSLQTSLFIAGHDAMHGSLLPGFPRWNHRLGAVAVALYAGLNYQMCRRHHRLHHRLTASPRDPDCLRRDGAGMFGWYVQFMSAYLSWEQLLRLLIVWAVVLILSFNQVPGYWLNFILFCVVPLCISSLQLFVFGTYLPHRAQLAARNDSQPESLDLPPWLSLLTCFHFGYHREHHDNPGVAWFDLPAQRR